jgi:hypothetical protein
MMKQILLAATLFITSASFAQVSMKDLMNKAKTVVSNPKSVSLSNDDIAAGLKEALAKGSEKSAKQLAAADGFYKDAAIKILFPPEVSKVETKLRAVGLGSLADNAILSMNRAAEDAAKTAAPIFLQAIKQMTVKDAFSILKGTDTAATSYLRGTTSQQLIAAFRPIVEASLKKVDATKYWKDAFTAYNRFSFSKVDTDVNSYVTGKALDGLFYYVAQEEKNIRSNPAARTTDILKKVFGQK